MSDSEQSFSWYDPESVRATVANGLANDIKKSRIAASLAEHHFDGISLSRVERIVDNTQVSDETSAATIDLSQPEATEAKPRDSVAKQLAVYDLEYVSNREAARLIGLALEQFDGNTMCPPATTQIETDLVWHRQHMTVALRIVPTPSGTVDTNHINALLEGTVVPEDTRNPSELAIVTNRAFTDEALAAADEYDIHCFDAGHVEEWFRRARIPMDVVGTVLEDGESHDGPLTDLVDVQPIPTPRKTVDPLEITRAFDIASLRTPADEDTTTRTSTAERPGGNEGQQETGLDRTTARDDPIGGTQAASGETGTLYADPDEDGDFEVFDQFVNDIKDGNPQSNSTKDEKENAADEVTSNTDEEATADDDAVNRGELVFDLIEAKQDAGEKMSSEDVRTYGSYPVEYYESEFGSIPNALAAANVEFTEGSQ